MDDTDHYPQPDIDFPEDARDARQRRLRYHGGWLEICSHDLSLAAARAGLRTAPPPVQARKRPPNLLARAVPKAVACKLLGVDKRTLADLINDGALRVVRWHGRTGGKVDVQRERIPMSEVERLCEEGIPEPGPRRRARRRPATSGTPAKDVAARIMSIPVK